MARKKPKHSNEAVQAKRAAKTEAAEKQVTVSASKRSKYVEIPSTQGVHSSGQTSTSSSASPTSSAENAPRQPQANEVTMVMSTEKQERLGEKQRALASSDQERVNQAAHKTVTQNDVRNIRAAQSPMSRQQPTAKQFPKSQQPQQAQLPQNQPQQNQQPQQSRPVNGTIAMSPVQNGGIAVLQGAAPSGGMLQFNVKEAQRYHRRRGLKVFGITFGILAALVALVYFGGVFLFSSHFYPNTTYMSSDISLKTNDEVADTLNDTMGNYSFTVSGQGINVTLTAEQAGLTVDGAAVSQNMRSDINPWKWPLDAFQKHDVTESLTGNIQTGTTGLADAIYAAVDEYNKAATPSVNASVVYNAGAQTYVVVPESYGMQIDPEAVINQVLAEVRNMPSVIHLNEDVLLKPSITSDDQLVKDTVNRANTMLGSNLEITVASTPVAKISQDQLAEWISITPDLSISLDQEAIGSWADSFNTVGTTRTYQRPDGKTVTVSGGDYGWTIDSASFASAVSDAVMDGTTKSVEAPVSSSAAQFLGAGTQDWGKRYVDIDLTEQYARFYNEEGALIWESPIVSGRPTSNGERDTPLGVWSLNNKERDVHLIGYNSDGSKEWDSPVEYWMPFVGNSVGLHDANWQSDFGGDRYISYGSRGCINLPTDKASEIYSLIRIDDVVITHT